MPKAEPKPVILSQGMIGKAVGDAKFYAQCPEFSTLKGKLHIMRVDMTRGGCSGCKTKRVQRNVYTDFVQLTMSLSADGQTRLKKYLGVSRLMLNMRDPATKQVKVALV